MMSNLADRPWRVGRKVGRTIYAQLGEIPSDNDPLIGVMDTRELAEDATSSHNALGCTEVALQTKLEEALAALRETDSWLWNKVVNGVYGEPIIEELVDEEDPQSPPAKTFASEEQLFQRGESGLPDCFYRLSPLSMDAIKGPDEQYRAGARDMLAVVRKLLVDDEEGPR